LSHASPDEKSRRRFFRPQPTRLPNPTPASLMRTLRMQHSTRFSMSLILAASISLALLTTKGLLTLGVLEMWVRYGVALIVAYATFFVGVWIWLHLSLYGRHLRARKDRSKFDGGVDVPIPDGWSSDGDGALRVASSKVEGGGGSFDGGGAGGSWDVTDSNVSVDFPNLSQAGKSLPDVGGLDAGGDEAGCLLVIAGILLAAVLLVIFGATAYVIYQAPAILAEVVFEVLLGSPLARGARALEASNWAGVLLAKTWKPFLVTAAMAIGFALFCKVFFPGAASMGELLMLL
jgi:hypothetical protein